MAYDQSAVVTAHYSSHVRPGVTRRNLLKLAAATGLAPWLLPGCSGVRPLPALRRSRGPLPPRFATHLPIPPALAVTREADGSDRCTLTLREGVQQILPDRTTLVWGGDGMFPCPTIEARSGRRLVLRLRNELPVPTVMHLHGGKTPAASDGYPTDLVLPAHGGLLTLGYMYDPGARMAEGEREYEYPNDQRAATLWYHDHRMDFTGPQVWRGLAGLYLLRDDEEETLPLPRGAREVPLVMCDRSFDEDGSFRYPALDPTLRERPGVLHAFMGGVLGDVARQRRAVAGARCCARALSLPPAERVQCAPVRTDARSSAARWPPFGTNRQRRRPAARARHARPDRHRAGRAFRCPRRLQPLCFRGAGRAPQSRRQRHDGRRHAVSRRPRRAGREPHSDASRRFRTARCPAGRADANFHLHERHTQRRKPLAGQRAAVRSATNGRAPRARLDEIWHLKTDVSHPIHLHLAPFQVLSQGGRPRPTDGGWKDTLDLGAGRVARVIVRFDGYKGRYVFHCHNLEHEDMAMMANFEVV